MKKTRSTKKIGSNSKRQPKKISRKRTIRNAPTLCSCVGHQVSSDSSSENLAVEDESHSTTDCGQIQSPVPAYTKRRISEEELAPRQVTTVITDKSHSSNPKNSKPLGQNGGISHSQNTASESATQSNRCPTKTKSSELIRLFYTIVADEDFLSEQSDSEDSFTSQVQHEVEVDVHHEAADMVVDNANEFRGHSEISVHNAGIDDPEMSTWFATDDLHDEGTSSLTEVTEESEYCDQIEHESNETYDTLSIDCKEASQELSNEEEYVDFHHQEDHVFQKESFLYVIDEVPEEECDSSSSISVDTVKDISLPCNPTIGVQDTPLHISQTQPDMSLVGGKETQDSIPFTEEGIELCDDAIVHNTMNQILINDVQTKPLQSLKNPIANSQEASIAFSQDQAVSEIIASGSKMVDEVKELISELLDVCMQSRTNDVASVAGHGDFEEASETSSRATHSDNAESMEIQNNNHGNSNQRESMGEGRDLAGTDLEKISSSDDIYVVDQGRNNEQSIPLETPPEELDSRVDQCDIIDLPPPVKTASGDQQCGNNDQLFLLEISSDSQCNNNDPPLHLETVVDGEIRDSSNNKSIKVGSPGCESQHETQPENLISDTRCNIVNYDNTTELFMRHGQHLSETVEDDEKPVFIPENIQPEFGDRLSRTDEMWPVNKIEEYDLAGVMPIQEPSYDKFDQKSPRVLKIIGVDIEQDSKTKEAPFENLASEEDAERNVQTPFENKIVKIDSVGIERDSKTHEALMKNLKSEEDIEFDVQAPFENKIVKIVGVDVEGSNLDVDPVDLCDIKIIGVDVETRLPALVASDSCSVNVQMDEEEDYSSAYRSKDEASGNGEAILTTCGGEDKIDMESYENVITKAERLDTVSSKFHQDLHSGQNDGVEDSSVEATGYGEIPTDTKIQMKAGIQEKESPLQCASPTSEGSNISDRSPFLSHSSFEILGQEVLEDDFLISPAIIVPPPQQEYNEEFMSPEFEADDIIVNVATVSAMGDVAPSPLRSGVSPVAQPDPVQFGDVNSRSPSPLPQTDLTLLECLFDICEDSLRRFPFKIEPPGLDTYVKEKSKPLELSPDCLGEQGDSRPIQNLNNQQSCVVSKESFGSISGDDEGFFCCDPPSFDSYSSLPSGDAEPERPLVAKDSSEKYFSFDTVEDFFWAEEEPLPLELDNSPEMPMEPRFQPNLDEQVISYDFDHPNRASDVTRPRTDETVSSQVTNENHADNSKHHLQTTFGNLNSSAGVPASREEETDGKFVFFLALFTFSLFVYCKYGTRVLQTIIHWIWVCQLIMQLIADS